MILDYKGIPVFYTDQGQGETVVLLHGFLENSSMWHPFISEMTASHRVVTIDLPGHGQTGCLGYVHTMEAMADVVRSVLHHLNSHEAKFIGHSMGGYVALAYAELYADEVRGLCLMNSTYEADDAERKRLRNRATIMAQQHYDNLVRMSFINLFSERSLQIYKSAIEDALEEALKTSPQGYCAAQKGMAMRKNTFQSFKELDCKKLVIIGEKDSVIDGEKLVKQLQNTPIETVIFSEGHMSHIENRKELSYKLMQFIEK